MKLKIHELAAKELLDAVKWYNQLQDGLGKRFQEMVVLQFPQKESLHAHRENYL
ncbi:MAG: hypothetical protein WCI64_00870 [Chlorobium sp.]